MQRFLIGTRYLILLPILGLALAAAGFFIFGGVGLIRLLIELIGGAFGSAHQSAQGGQGVIIFEVVEYVHTFLVGTVLYITAVGLYQLFIREIEFAGGQLHGSGLDQCRQLTGLWRGCCLADCCFGDVRWLTRLVGKTGEGYHHLQRKDEERSGTKG